MGLPLDGKSQPSGSQARQGRRSSGAEAWVAPGLQTVTGNREEWCPHLQLEECVLPGGDPGSMEYEAQGIGEQESSLEKQWENCGLKPTPTRQLGPMAPSLLGPLPSFLCLSGSDPRGSSRLAPSPPLEACPGTHQDHRHSIVQHPALHCEPLIVQSSDWAGQGHVQGPSAERREPQSPTKGRGQNHPCWRDCESLGPD